MAEEIFLIFSDPVDEDEFLDLVVELGGVRLGEYEDARLSRERKHVWITTNEENIPGMEPEDALVYEAKLGRPPRREVILSISGTKGSDHVAMEIIEAAARRWQLIVDNNHGGLYTVDELHAYADATGTLPFA